MRLKIRKRTLEKVLQLQRLLLRLDIPSESFVSESLQIGTTHFQLLPYIKEMLPM